MLSNSKNKPLANKETKDRRTRPPVSLTVKTFVRLSQHLILAWFPPASGEADEHIQESMKIQPGT